MAFKIPEGQEEIEEFRFVVNGKLGESIGEYNGIKFIRCALGEDGELYLFHQVGKKIEFLGIAEKGKYIIQFTDGRYMRY